MSVKLHIKKGDMVQVIAGDNKGQQGKVLKVEAEKQRAIVEGVNLCKKATKPNAQNPQGGIVEKEAPIHVSNLQVLDPKGGKPTKVGRRLNAKGKLVRYAKKSRGGDQIMAYVPTLKTQYKEQIVAALMKEFGYSSVMQCPKLTKIVINQGMGQAVADKKLIDVAEAELTQITGQKAVQTRSRKDISNFKLRKGMPIGVRVTLRDTKMYEFLERLIAVALPRIRDFKGINEKFDGQGNYTLGITEQIIFPEIDIDKITKIFGMEITFVTTAKTDEEAYALLREFGLPFKNAKKNQ